MKQRTLSKNYHFEGKGLHTGASVRMDVGPAPAGTGIRFIRTDISPDAVVDALASNVCSTSRSTELSCGKARVRTVEHLLAALTGLGVDNALVRIDSAELPILDGSAKPYVEAMSGDPFPEQDMDRKWIELSETHEYRNEKTGSYIRLEPADELSYECTIDFNSKVLGVQTVSWKPGEDFVNAFAPCRTFCFLHEIQAMVALGLVKGGDVENAIIIVEKPVSDRMLAILAKRFSQPLLSVTPEGYLSNLVLRFPDECGRHKLLDLIGDLRLAGGFLKARITAYKPGHSINTNAIKDL